MRIVDNGGSSVDRRREARIENAAFRCDHLYRPKGSRRRRDVGSERDANRPDSLRIGEVHRTVDAVLNLRRCAIEVDRQGITMDRQLGANGDRARGANAIRLDFAGVLTVR